jgi:hypothetical protein
MQEYLTFRKMLTPVAIQVIFWIGALVCVVLGLVMVVSGATARFGGGEQVLGGILTLLLGPVVVRISCEVLIVVFRILDTLVEIRDRLRG